MGTWLLKSHCQVLPGCTRATSVWFWSLQPFLQAKLGPDSWYRRCWKQLRSIWCRTSQTGTPGFQAELLSAFLVNKVKTGLWSVLLVFVSLFHRGRKKARRHEEMDVVKVSNSCRAHDKNQQDFLPRIYGVCMFKYAHTQRYATFCTLRQVLLPRFGLCPACFGEVWGVGYTQLWEFLYDLCNLLGTGPMCDDGFGPQVLTTGLLSACFL